MDDPDDDPGWRRPAVLAQDGPDGAVATTAADPRGDARAAW